MKLMLFSGSKDVLPCRGNGASSNKWGGGNTNGNDKQCYRCNSSNHLADCCHFKNVKCHQCGRIGHIQRACTIDAAPKYQQAVLVELGETENEGAKADSAYCMCSNYQQNFRRCGDHVCRFMWNFE